MFIDSPILDEVKELIRQRYEAEFFAKGYAEGILIGLRNAVTGTLETRFGAIPAERVAPLQVVAAEDRLDEQIPLAITCADLGAFTAALAAGA